MNAPSRPPVRISGYHVYWLAMIPLVLLLLVLAPMAWLSAAVWGAVCVIDAVLVLSRPNRVPQEKAAILVSRVALVMATVVIALEAEGAVLVLAALVPLALQIDVVRRCRVQLHPGLVEIGGYGTARIERNTISEFDVARHGGQASVRALMPDGRAILLPIAGWPFSASTADRAAEWLRSSE